MAVIGIVFLMLGLFCFKGSTRTMMLTLAVVFCLLAVLSPTS